MAVGHTPRVGLLVLNPKHRPSLPRAHASLPRVPPFSGNRHPATLPNIAGCWNKRTEHYTTWGRGPRLARHVFKPGGYLERVCPTRPVCQVREGVAPPLILRSEGRWCYCACYLLSVRSILFSLSPQLFFCPFCFGVPWFVFRRITPRDSRGLRLFCHDCFACCVFFLQFFDARLNNNRQQDEIS